MTDANPYRNAAQDPDFLARKVEHLQNASPETLARYREFFKTQRDQDQITRAIAAYAENLNSHAMAAYEETRMAPRPKPRFCLTIDADHFYAKPSRAGLIDVIAVAVGGALWFAILAGLWVIFG